MEAAGEPYASSRQGTLQDQPTTVENEVMRSSYHEIWEGEDEDRLEVEEERKRLAKNNVVGEGAKRLLNKARDWVGDLSLDGVVSQQGHQLTYVAQDIHKIISSSSDTLNIPPPQSPPAHVDGRNYRSDDPPSRGGGGADDNLQKNTNTNTTASHQPQQVQDINLLINDIELEAKKLASSVDTLTENLTGILHSLSSMTVDCVFAGSDGISQLTDTADASIKVMYQVMAKSEELNKAVQPIYQVHQQIKDTKKLLDKVEGEIN